jgi:hypothetical protein
MLLYVDTLSERDSLIDNVFPKLKDYCREKYGLEFQVSRNKFFLSCINISLFIEVFGYAMGNSN